MLFSFLLQKMTTLPKSQLGATKWLKLVLLPIHIYIVWFLHYVK